MTEVTKLTLNGEMDEEDRTATPIGCNEALWRKADEVFHSCSLVADDAECVKIVYAALAAQGQEPAALTPDEKHIGVIRSTDREGNGSRVSVNQWSDKPSFITFGIHLSDCRWAQADLLPHDAAKVAALILSKPAVAAVTAQAQPGVPLEEAQEIVVEAISRMRAAHVSCLDLTTRAEEFLRATHIAAPAQPVGVPDDNGAMTPEEIRLENLKQMATYDGPIVSFEVSDGYYLASCDKCGWVGSSEHCGKDYWGDDSDVYCPRCSASGADCGKVAERLERAAPQPPVQPGAPAEWLNDGPLTPEEAWTILCETPDITSPAEYPDHALITMEQLASFMQRAAPQPPAEGGWMPTHRHKKRGSTYAVIATGRLQVDGDLDMERVTIYQAEDGTTWVRPDYEFNDGRFEALPPTPATGGRQ